MTGNCALYVRISTQDQDLEGQERELRNYAHACNWNVVGVYREKASATGRTARDEYDRLLQDSTRPDRQWRHLLVWSMDRFSREEQFTRAIENIWRLESKGIHFHSLKEPAIDTPEDNNEDLGRTILRAILPIIASFESRRRSERVRVAMNEIRQGRRQTRSGRPPGRPLRATMDKVERAYILRQEGKSWGVVAKHVGLPVPTIRRAVALYRGSSHGDQKA